MQDEENILELRKIAETSSSFDDFLIKVAKWLKLKEKTEIFVTLIKIATKCNEVTWNSLLISLRREEMVDFNVHKFTRSITKGLKDYGYSVKLLDFITLVADYDEYDFSQNHNITDLASFVLKIEESEVIKQCKKDQQEIEQLLEKQKKLMPKMSEFAETSENFEDFANKIADWLLEDQKQKNIFLTLMDVSLEVEKFKWSELIFGMKKRGDVNFNRYRLEYNVRKYGCQMTLIEILRCIRHYGSLY